MRFRLAVASLTLLFFRAIAQTAPPGQTELNGVLLGQYAKVLDATFGEPTRVTNGNDHSTARAYVFDKLHNAYMVFEIPPGKDQRVMSIQVTGDAGTPLKPFMGLSLGDTKEKVLELLGKPEKIEP